MMSELTRGRTQTRIYMDTPVVIELSPAGLADAELAERTERAFAWFAEVERRCSRFDEASELRRLSRSAGERVPVSELLFNALALAIEVAEATDGALDPAIGRRMEGLGYDTNYLSHERVASSSWADPSGSYRDILLDAGSRTVRLLRPLALDLGAVAKGLAIDLAAQELQGLPGFVVNAGGDIVARGSNPDGEPWKIGIRHPRQHDELIASLSITDAAVCTSGGYERPQSGDDGHHIIDPATGRSATDALSVTVIAPTAVVADALSTAAFVLGPESGIALLAREGVDGIVVTADLRTIATPGFERYR